MCEQADGEKDQSWPEISSNPYVTAMHDDFFFAVFGSANASISDILLIFLNALRTQ